MKSDEHLWGRYPRLNLGHIREPCIVRDIHERVVLVYLPGLLDLEQQVSYNLSAQLLLINITQNSLIDPMVHISTDLSKSVATSGNWRTNNIHFKPCHDSRFTTGAINFSSGWIDQGHQIKCFSVFLIFIYLKSF